MDQRQGGPDELAACCKPSSRFPASQATAALHCNIQRVQDQLLCLQQARSRVRHAHLRHKLPVLPGQLALSLRSLSHLDDLAFGGHDGFFVDGADNGGNLCWYFAMRGG